MPSAEAQREARRALERRLLQERALFAGSFSAFIVTLYLDLQGATFLDPAVYFLIAACGLTGAGLDGAREGLKDIGLLAGILEHGGAGSKVARVPFWSRGHYEVWFESPSPVGARKFGLSFANSLFFREKKSRYLLMVPLEPGKHVLDGIRPREPYRETGTGGALEGKALEYWLSGPSRGHGLEWHLALFVSPGRPLDLGGALELKRRAEAMAERITKEGAGAVQWGANEKFRALAAEEVPEGSTAQLREPMK